LGEEGGLNSNWAYLDMKWFRLPFPNTASRKKAVIFHDIHHIVTGYRSNWQGEAEIAAWEVSSGCGEYSAAWVLDIGGMGMGLCFFPRATYRAFIRGQRSRNLYHHLLTREQAMTMTITQLQSLLGLDLPQDASASFREISRFIGWSALALLADFVCFVLPYLLLILWIAG
jgi:hypothetical protein